MDMINVVISLVLGAVAGFFASFLTEKGKNFATKQDIALITDTQAKVQSQYDAKLENLRGEITRSRDVLNAAIANFSQGYQASQQRRLDAIEVMWTTMLQVKRMASGSIAFYSLLLPSEYNDAFTKPGLAALIRELDLDKITNTISSNMEQVDLVRPFLGETLHSLYFSYQALLGRVTLRLAKGWRDKNIPSWIDDGHTRQILGTLLPEDHISMLTKEKLPSLKLAIELVDLKIMQAVNRSIVGETAATESLAQATRILAGLKAMEAGGAKANQ